MPYKKEACSALWSNRLFLIAKRDRSNGPLRNQLRRPSFRLRGSLVSGSGHCFYPLALAARGVFDQWLVATRTFSGSKPRPDSTAVNLNPCGNPEARKWCPFSCLHTTPILKIVFQAAS